MRACAWAMAAYSCLMARACCLINALSSAPKLVAPVAAEAKGAGLAGLVLAGLVLAGLVAAEGKGAGLAGLAGFDLFGLAGCEGATGLKL